MYKQTVSEGNISTQVPYCVRLGEVCWFCLLFLCSRHHLIPQMMCAVAPLVSSWAWIREYSRPPLKGSRKGLLLVNKQSSNPRWLEVKKQGRFVVSRTNLKNCGGFDRSVSVGPIGYNERADRDRERKIH